MYNARELLFCHRISAIMSMEVIYVGIAYFLGLQREK